MAFYDYAEKVKHRVSFCQKNHNLSPKKTKKKKTIVDSLVTLSKKECIIGIKARFCQTQFISKICVSFLSR